MINVSVNCLKRKIIKIIRSRIIGTVSQIEIEKAEQCFYVKYLEDGMTVFDIGANIGEFTLLFSKFVGDSGRVHSFEACKDAYVKMEKICQLANKKNVILNNNAVFDKDGISKINVYPEEYSTWNTFAKRSFKHYGLNLEPEHLEEVQCIKIDTYCQKNNISQIDLLKVDVEGAEHQVLLGAKEMLAAHRIKCIVFECGETTTDMGNDVFEIGRYLSSFGYKIENIIVSEPLFPIEKNTGKPCFSIHVARQKS